MLNWIVCLSLGWSAVVFFYLLMFRGGSGRRTKMDKFLLFLSCVLWPLTLVVIFLLLTGVIRRRTKKQGKEVDTLLWRLAAAPHRAE